MNGFGWEWRNWFEDLIENVAFGGKGMNDFAFGTFGE
jgi:hypothetical protein